MFRKLRLRFPHIIVSILASALVTSCTTPATQVIPTALPPVPTETSVPPTPTLAPQPTATISGQAFSLTLDGVAQSTSSELVPAVQKTADSSWWQPMPKYLAITLNTYPVNGPIKPQIFIIPTADLPAWNPQADQQVKDMQALLASHQVNGTMPFLPLKSEVQVMQAAIQGLNFKNGQGVRYLTQYNSGIVPVNNQQLFYTYQGLTSDGQYYVSAVLPVIYPGLPTDNQSLPPADDPFFSNHAAYVAGIVKTLSESPTSTFTPDLSTLDQLMSSIEVK